MRNQPFGGNLLGRLNLPEQFPRPNRPAAMLTKIKSLPEHKLDDILNRNHTLNGAVLIGLDGLLIEAQASAMELARGEVGENEDAISRL